VTTKNTVFCVFLRTSLDGLEDAHLQQICSTRGIAEEVVKLLSVDPTDSYFIEEWYVHAEVSNI
jgi:hypothetical protein